MRTCAEVNPIAGGNAMGMLVEAYLQGRSPQEEPLASPYYGEYIDLPPLLFHVGEASCVAPVCALLTASHPGNQ